MRGVPLSALTQRHRNFACNCVCVWGRDYCVCVSESVCECGRLDASTHTHILLTRWLSEISSSSQNNKNNCALERERERVLGLPHKINNNNSSNRETLTHIELGSTMFLLLLLLLPINSANFGQICFCQKYKKKKTKEGGQNTQMFECKLCVKSNWIESCSWRRLPEHVCVCVYELGFALLC